MKTAKKSLLLISCAILLVAASVLGTMAYLTSQKSVTNTFTVGNVNIKLDEAKVNADGTEVTPASRTEEGNEYHLVPGHSYTKDPTVTVLKNSEESYVRAIVTVENIDKLKAAFPVEKFADYYSGDVFLLEKLVEGWDNAKWVYNNYSDGKYEFRYYQTITKNSTNDTKLEPLFEKIKLPGEGVTNNTIVNLKTVKIVVNAHAIQKDGFNTADAAWEAFENEVNTATAGE